MTIHRIELFAFAPGQVPAMTTAASALCPPPCAVQTFQLTGDDQSLIEVHIVWENKSRGLAKMAFIPPGSPPWAERAVMELVNRKGAASHFRV